MRCSAPSESDIELVYIRSEPAISANSGAAVKIQTFGGIARPRIETAKNRMATTNPR
jgi:hypothetical protein